MTEEYLEVVDGDGNVLSVAPRSEIHGNPALMHRVVHVLVFNSEGGLILQKRSMDKDVAPGRWDTSVGGHVDAGESLEAAALREMAEELGIECEVEYLYNYIHSNDYETELVYTYRCTHDGPYTFNPEEIDKLSAWSMKQIARHMTGKTFSDNFKHEITTYLAHTGAI